MVLGVVLIGAATANAEGLKAVCPAATEGTVECMSFEITGVVSFEGSGEKGGLSPADLRSAYKLPTSGGSGQTVAIVDAYNDPNAESDLKTYRSHYGLSECTTANGCFKKVNQKGEAGSYPANESGWSTEMSLDLDMVSAVCSECHILLVEASSASFSNMDTAENEAATLKGTEISNSWGAPERSGETSEDKYFEHSGIPITVSAGDSCYINECKKLQTPNWPAMSPDVIAVGGTKLEKASNSRGWNESVWYEPTSEYGPIGTGSGCSLYESKPAWETGSSCSKRTDGDVAAVAACKSPLSIYDSYEREGWFVECGTSAAAPIVAGVEGLSPAEARKEGPELFWKLGSKGKLFDITEGSNYYSAEYSSCGSYLCEAKVGYDGPTGNGTPDGVFKVSPPPSVTTGSATAITEKEATLNGTVNPNGSETKYYFEYGTTTSYGKNTTEVSAGSGTSTLEESATITGLSSKTEYHFRIVATHGTEATYGVDQVFNTAPFVWSLQEPPFLTGAKETSIVGVSCTSSATCGVTGWSENSSKTRVPLAERWNGTTWSVQEPPIPTEATFSSLYGVSCTASTACTSVGFFEHGGQKALAERWNGSAWSIQEVASPTGAKLTDLRGVSCTSSTACTAVGFFENSSGKQVPLAEVWNGTSWSAQEPPIPTGAKAGSLWGVSCSSSTACIAAGDFTSSSGINVPLAERWNGASWSVQEPSDPTEVTRSELEGVSCTSSTACTAVGFYAVKSGEWRPLAERWNGTTWSVQEPPIIGKETDDLTAVSCTSATACVAVGRFVNNSKDERSVAEMWNGTKWTAEEPEFPAGAGRLGELWGVSCVSSTVCMAGGFFETSSGEWRPLANHYH
jgi:hypothetical protein